MQAVDTLFEELTGAGRTEALRRVALARAITLVESDRPQDRGLADALVERCLPLAGRTLRVGITGIPGVGKSTLIDALGMALLAQGHRVAVLAVDPSSVRTGGSILGDKTRMERLSNAEGAFIRPTPTGGDLGGVARRTRETMVLCEAAGFDRVLVETVGVGQSELEVDRMTDLTLLLMIAGAGDELQGIKRGIMEAADLVALTKADTDADGRMRTAVNDLRQAIALLPTRPSGRHPEVVLTSAVNGRGIDTLVEQLDALYRSDLASGHFVRRRQEQDLHWLDKATADALLRAFHADERVREALMRSREDVRTGRRSAHAAAEELVRLFRTGVAPRP
jgi:LAO/AO transport system kinase